MPKNSDAGDVEVIGLYAACHDVGVTSPEVPDGNSHKVDRTGKLGRVGAAERELAIDDLSLVSRLERDRDLVRRNHTLREEIVRDYKRERAVSAAVLTLCGVGAGKGNRSVARSQTRERRSPVGMVERVSGESVSRVRSVGPILRKQVQSVCDFHSAF